MWEVDKLERQDMRERGDINKIKSTFNVEKSRKKLCHSRTDISSLQRKIGIIHCAAISTKTKETFFFEEPVETFYFIVFYEFTQLVG